MNCILITSAGKLELYTDDDTIVGDLVNGTVKYMKSGRIIEFSAERDEYQARELQYFLDVIKERKKVQNDVSNAAKVLRLTQGDLL